MDRILTSASSIVLLLLLSACGKTLELNATNVHTISNQIVDAVNISVGAYAAPATFMVSSTCQPQATGNTVDTDADGISEDGTLSFSCSDVSVVWGEVQGTGNLIGTIEATDDDESDSMSGFSVRLSGFSKEITAANQETANMNFGLDLEASVSSSSVTVGVDYESSVSNTSPQGSASIALSFDLDFILSPSTSALQFAGEIGVESADESGTLAVASQELVYTETACSGKPGITGGAISIEDEISNSLVITYASDCTSSSTLNNAVVTR